ncbi:unnamed protein product [Sphagnum jensenii]|uniref:Secreted protein n=1 Tax=Sphagnum jensenii TaxID=128206 RepID=A0ABP1BAT2_9BRYO
MITTALTIMSAGTVWLELASFEVSGARLGAQGGAGGTGKPLLAELNDLIWFISLARPTLPLKPTYMCRTPVGDTNWPGFHQFAVLLRTWPHQRESYSGASSKRMSSSRTDVELKLVKLKLVG